MFRRRHCLLVVSLWLCSIGAYAECIGLALAGGGKGFWEEVENGARQAAEELGVELYSRGIADEVASDHQHLIIRSIEKAGCSGLVIAPNDIHRQEDVLRLQNAGVKTVFIDRDVGGARIGIIKTDNYNAGRVAGEAMVDALSGHGRVMVLRMDPNVQTTTARENGFIDAVREAGMEVILAPFVGTTVGEVRGRTRKLLVGTTAPDGIFTPNEVTTMGVIAELRSMRKAGQILHIGFDASRYIKDALRDGHLYGYIEQQPYLMGYLGVHYVFKAIHGQEIEESIETQVLFVTQLP